MTKETSLPAKQRIWELDALRGLCILCMVAIHAFWDLSAFGGFTFDLPVWALAVLGVAFVALGVWFESFYIPVNFLFPLGLRAQGFYCGGDYFPLLPGFGWFLLGAVIGRTAYRKKQSLLPRVNAANPVIRFFSFCGRHSLLIYMLHQPVLTIGTILIFG